MMNLQFYIGLTRTKSHFCPALTDGSIGDMLFFHTFKASPQQLRLDIVADIRKINSMSMAASKAGMIILGGWIDQTSYL